MRQVAKMSSVVEMKKLVKYVGFGTPDGAGGDDVFYLPGAVDGPGGTLGSPIQLFLHPCVTKQAGIAKDQIIGTDTFRRYLKAKIRLVFPRTVVNTETNTLPLNQGAISAPTDIYIIWGWCPSANFSEFTDPKGVEADWTGTDPKSLTNYVTTRVKDYYNEKNDRMLYHEATDKPYTIDGIRKVQLNREHSIRGVQPFFHEPNTTTVPAPPDYYTSIRWKLGMNRKITNVRSTGTNSWHKDGTTQNPWYYPGPNEPIPWVMIWNPDRNGQGQIAQSGVAPPTHRTGKIRYQMSFVEYFNDP